ncbi:hypothetical protein CKO31_12210 [Thiohalocapsa halophila]|uniref:Uncharacterized protein n=1 Tax=Thiohalocapsa halophila TaxID=69359 RepID=A0ABS1CHU7_9GAMM|nr:hypothetical protein [Thiohalocapsa halophila]MBK1631492.1 hypothetical protein [Thiohalocapsa halophila]
MTQVDPLVTAIWEGGRHLAVLEQALGDWQTAPAAHLAELDADADKLRLPDQLLFRFTKLQDAMGARLVPAALAAQKHAKNGGFVARSGPFALFACFVAPFQGAAARA